MVIAMHNTPSFLWYDLETFGRDPRRSRIAQLACLRTDGDLDPLGEPETFLCRLDEDILPSPRSCIVTGITPQRSEREGLAEPVFADRAHGLMSQPDTCIAGFNNIRFDDEFLRHLFYRNFHDPYEREWKNGNSRFDLLDALRMAYALRPDGLGWPLREDGAPSFRLADLAAANGIAHQAHDAEGDTLATVALARRLKEAQPKLWHYLLRLRDKRAVERLLEIGVPILHVSGRYPASRGCAAIVLPLAWLRDGQQSVLAFDLSVDPQMLLDLGRRPAPDLDAMREQLGALPPYALKRIRPNRLPALARLEHVREEELRRLGLDLRHCHEHARLLKPHLAAIGEMLRVLFTRDRSLAPDPELALYERFLPDPDRSLLPLIRAAPPSALASFAARLQDPRLRTLLFRRRARHFPETLDAEERRRWDHFCRRRPHDHDLSEITAAEFFAELAAMEAEGADPEILEDLRSWASRKALTPVPAQPDSPAHAPTPPPSGTEARPPKD
jgi:exodeoxyribonuclease-1